MCKPFLPLLFFVYSASLALVRGPGFKCVQVEDEIRCEGYRRVPHLWELYRLPDGDREDRARGWTVVLYPFNPRSSCLIVMHAMRDGVHSARPV